MNSCIALDLEATRLEARQEKITKITVIKIVDRIATEQLAAFVSPARRLGMRITRLTGITGEMLKDVPLIENVIGNTMEFFGDLSFLGYNIMFNYSFLKHAVADSRLESGKEGLDTLMLCRAFMPGGMKQDLFCACSYHHISRSTARRVQADAETAHRLYQELLELHSQDGPGLFTSKPLIYRARGEQLTIKRQKEYLQDLVRCHRTDATVQIDDINRSGTSRTTDIVISQCGRIPRQTSWMQTDK